MQSTLHILANISLESAQNFVSLQPLLQRAKSLSSKANTIYGHLFQLLGYELKPELPIGAVSGLADGLATYQGGWLRADPVELEVEQGRVFMRGNEHLHLRVNEVDALTMAINKFLIEEDLQLFAPKPLRWYIQVKTPPQLITHSTDSIIGKSIMTFLPKGSQHYYWHSLWNEIQNLLYKHPVNQKRLRQEQPIINSLWLWGSGCLPKPVLTQWRHLYGVNPVLHGLAKLNELPFYMADSFKVCEKKMHQAGNYLLMIDTPHHIEELWFEPLHEALLAQQLKEVIFYFNNTRYFRLSAKKLKPWWKRLG